MRPFRFSTAFVVAGSRSSGCSYHARKSCRHRSVERMMRRMRTGHCAPSASIASSVHARWTRRSSVSQSTRRMSTCTRCRSRHHVILRFRFPQSVASLPRRWKWQRWSTHPSSSAMVPTPAKLSATTARIRRLVRIGIMLTASRHCSCDSCPGRRIGRRKTISSPSMVWRGGRVRTSSTPRRQWCAKAHRG